MDRIRKFFCLALVLTTVTGLLPPAKAQSAAMAVDAYGVALIEQLEGYSQYAYLDSSQWTIGYGSKCEQDQFPDGLTKAEAEALLEQQLADYEISLNQFLNANSISVTQTQYDALLSFTYNLGASWMTNLNYQICKCLIAGADNCSDLEIMNAFGPWSHVGTTLSAPLLDRRRIEAQLFLSGKATAQKSFYYVIYNANGGKVDDDVLFYTPGSQIGELETPVLAGANFYGWYTAAAGGKKIDETQTVTADTTLYAHWTNDASGPADAGTTGTMKPVTEKSTFSDVDTGDWYYYAVEYAAENGFLSGTTTTRFSPESKATRAMMVTVLYRMAGSPESTAQSFSDTAGTWCDDAVRWAAENGIANGVGNGLFSPNASVTREQMAKLLYQYAAYRGQTMSVSHNLTAFTDASNISDWAAEPMSWAVDRGLLSGVSDGCLDPSGTATRAQIAVIVMRYCEMLENA